MKINDRTLIVGKTGSGKSVLAAQILLDVVKDNPKCSVLIINHKREAYLNKLLPPLKKLPKGFNIGDRINICPMLGDKDDDEKLNKILSNIYDMADSKKHKGTIILVDEGLMIHPRDRMMLALQTQGRSLNVGIITLTQRPFFISQFAITQASNIYIYNVMGRNDIKALDAIVRPKDDKLETLIDDLKQYEYIAYDDNGINKTSPAKFPVVGKITPLKRKLSLPLLSSAIVASITAFLLVH